MPSYNTEHNARHRDIRRTFMQCGRADEQNEEFQTKKKLIYTCLHPTSVRPQQHRHKCTPLLAESDLTHEKQNSTPHRQLGTAVYNDALSD